MLSTFSWLLLFSSLSSTFYTLTENLNFPEAFGVLICSIGGKWQFQIEFEFKEESFCTIKEACSPPYERLLKNATIAACENVTLQHKVAESDIILEED